MQELVISVFNASGSVLRRGGKTKLLRNRKELKDIKYVAI